MSEPNPDFSYFIKKVRVHLKMSQEGLARELGMSFSTINGWENEKTRPNRVARSQIDTFCAKMVRQGKLSKDLLE